MTDKELDEISARANAAAPGPWCYDYQEKHVHGNPTNVLRAAAVGQRIHSPSDLPWIADIGANEIYDEQRRANADFIAAARTDIPALVAEVHRLRALKITSWAKP